MVSRTAAIETYLRQRLQENPGGLEIRRRELAQRFACVPSQITYVLATRFTPEAGYLVESRRGGGGFIRIRPVARFPWLQLLWPDGEAHPLSQEEARSLVDEVRRQGLISEREAAMIKAAMDLPAAGLEGHRDQLRAYLLRAMLRGLLKQIERG